MKIRRIQNESTCPAVDNTEPKTFKMSKRLTEHRHPDSHAVMEHLRNIAAM